MTGKSFIGLIVVAFCYLIFNSTVAEAENRFRPPRATSYVKISAVLDQSSAIIAESSIPLASLVSNNEDTVVTFADLQSNAGLSIPFSVYDSRGKTHTLLLCFFHIEEHHWLVRLYGYSQDFGAPVNGYPRQLTVLMGSMVQGTFHLYFGANGKLNTSISQNEIIFVFPWSNGSEITRAVNISLPRIKEHLNPSQLLKVSRDGRRKKRVTS